MRFLASDAWVLHAIAIASRHGPATLADVLAAADACNHALPTEKELHGALFRLTNAGFLIERDEHFELTERVSEPARTTMLAGESKAGRDAASALLGGAQSWTDAQTSSDPRETVIYPRLTDERIKRADREYRRTFWNAYRRFRNARRTNDHDT